MQLLGMENEEFLNSETLAIAYFDLKIVTAWGKGIRASVCGIISGKPFEHTSIAGAAKILGEYGTREEPECVIDFMICCTLRV